MRELVLVGAIHYIHSQSFLFHVSVHMSLVCAKGYSPLSVPQIVTVCKTGDGSYIAGVTSVCLILASAS